MKIQKAQFNFDSFMSGGEGATAEAPPVEKHETHSAIDEFLKNASSTPKQQYNHTDLPPNPEQVAADQEAEKAEKEQIKKESLPAEEHAGSTVKSRNGAEMIIRTFDFIFAKTAQFFAKTPTSKEWKADEDEAKEMIDAWDRYLQTLRGDIPPWIGIAIVMLLVYGLKIPVIIEKRNENIEKKEKAEREAFLKAQREKAASEAMNNTHNDRETDKKQEPENDKIVDGEVIRNCLMCQEPLSPAQILRGGSFCGTAHANQYRMKMQKQQQNQNS